MSDEREVVKYPSGSVTITFPAEMTQEIHKALHAQDYLSVLFEFDQLLRGIVKYGSSPVRLKGEDDSFTPHQDTVQYLRDCLWESMADHSVSMDDLS